MHEVLFQRDSSGPAPKVTVIITLFNYERYIVECLESVESQSLLDLDLLVADDCSRDGSTEVCRNWLSKHAGRFRRCQLVGNLSNQGLAATRNLLFSMVRTEYVFVLDADNMIYPRCLQTLASALDHCDASFSYCYLERFGVETGLISCLPWNSQQLLRGNFIDAMSLVRRDAWRQAGGYATDMPAMGWEDFDFWLRVARSGGWGILVPEVLARYRAHLKSMLRTETSRRETIIWDYLERNHQGIQRRVESSESCLPENDEIHLHCDRIRYLDHTPDGPHLKVSGWAVSRFSVARIEVLLDHEEEWIARYGDFRPELRGRVRGYPNEARCGFSLNSKVGPLDPGAHTVSIRAISKSGKTIEIRRTLVLDPGMTSEVLVRDYVQDARPRAGREIDEASRRLFQIIE
jgi:glycosyltransferase involved in cell wall biosynthesis